MIPFRIIKSLVIIGITTAMLTACAGSGTPVPPTVDPNVIYTQAAQTVVAGLARTPSATVAAPTRTNTPPVAPTAGAGATQPAAGVGTPTQSATRTTPVTQLTVTPGIGGVVLTPPVLLTQPGPGQATALVPTNTAAAKVPTGDKCTYEGQDPADGTVLKPNQQFPMKWTIRNTGSTTWRPTYQVKFFGGNKMSGPADYDIPREVKPNESVNINFYLVAPDTAGSYKSGWALLNAEGFAFCFFDISVDVK